MKTVEHIINEALDGKLRTTVEVCNCAGDRAFLAKVLARELQPHIDRLEAEKAKLVAACKAAEQTLRNLASAFIIGDNAIIAKNEAANLRAAPREAGVEEN